MGAMGFYRESRIAPVGRSYRIRLHRADGRFYRINGALLQWLPCPSSIPVHRPATRDRSPRAFRSTRAWGPNTCR